MAGIVIRNLPEQLVDLVRDRILAGTVDSGHAIRQDTLATELGVSKIPLREALTRLEQEGLVTSRVNRGYFVRELSASEAEEIYALRLKIEPEIAALAAARATDEERREVVMTLDRLDQLTNECGASVGAANRAFHIGLIRPSAQPITIQLLERLHVMGERYARKHLEPLGRDQRANDEHAALMESWLARDHDAIVARMHAHIERTIVDLRQQFANG